MKKTSLKMRILSLIMVLCMSFAMMSVTALAVEDPNPDTNTGIPNEPDRAIGPVLYSDTANFVNYTTISITMTSGEWDADFLVAITGNAGAMYEVVMTIPSGSSYTTYVTSGTGHFTTIATLIYAAKGTYTFSFTRISGSANTAHAIVEICD